MIKQLLNSVAAKYRDQLATDKLRYFARPRPIIVKISKRGVKSFYWTIH